MRQREGVREEEEEQPHGCLSRGDRAFYRGATTTGKWWAPPDTAQPHKAAAASLPAIRFL